MCLKPFVKMCIFVVIQIFWSLRKYREQLECAASNGNRYPAYPQVMATAISQ